MIAILSSSSKLLLLLSLISLIKVEATPRRHQLTANISTALAKDRRIVGGQEVKDKVVPFIVSLMRNGKHQCGGSILNARTIMTVAHCIDQYDPSIIQIHVGDQTLKKDKGKIIGVEAVHWHERFDTPKRDNDIGLVRLKEPLQFNDRVKPIALIEAKTVLKAGSYATVYGWGRTKFNGQISEVLKYVRVPLVNLEQCKHAYGGKAVTDNMLCAGEEAGGADSCQNDSGGPLEQNGSLIGLVSWGKGCGWKGYPGIYTDVQRQLPWIKETLKREYGEQI